MLKLKRFKYFPRRRTTLIFLVATLTLGFLYLANLGSWTPGISPAEATARQNSISLNAIADNPVYAPHKIIQHMFLYIGDSAFWLRVPSAIIGVLMLFSFYIVARKWFGKTVGLYSLLIFLTLPWALLLARHGVPQIMLLGNIVFLAAIVWLITTDRHNIALILLSIACALLLYIPGMIWVILAGLLCLAPRFMPAVGRAGKWTKMISCLVFVLLLAPLVMAAADNQQILLRLALIPPDIAPLPELARSIYWQFSGLFVSTRDPHPLVLGRMPLLGVIPAALMLIGSYVMWVRAKREFALLVFIILISIVGGGINRDLWLAAMALPVAILLVAAGLRFLYAEWHNVFPVNPIPKGFAFLVIAAVVSLHAAIGLRYVYSAWPNTVSTTKNYVLK